MSSLTRRGFLNLAVAGLGFIYGSGTVKVTSGESMYPTLNRLDLIFVDIFSRVKTGDVVTLLTPEEETLVCKRIIGMGGDVLVSRNKGVVAVPPGQCWVEGDNTNSLDSNSFGPVPVQNILGCVKYSFVPYLRKIENLGVDLSVNMRSVCFVKRLEFDFGGNVFRSSLELGDVDNSGDMSLVAGNASGDLAIFKGEHLWQKMTGLGLITAVGVGDILNCGLNAVVVVCGDGWCHIFFCPEGGNKLESVHVQRIPANTKVLLLGDIDGNGEQELVLGLTDRVVRSYRWCWTSTPFSRDSTPESINGSRGILVCLNKWEFAHQLGAVTLSHQAGGKPCLLVAQPGGTFLRIRCNVDQENPESNEADQEGATSGSERRPTILNETSVDYHPLCISSMRNPNVSTEILGDIETGRKCDDRGTPYAVATLDGTLMLVHDEEILWSIQVDHQLFAVTKLDATGDGRDEIVVCSWDGQTYLLDQERRSVRFQLEETVSGFCSGKYSIQVGAKAIPALVYATFNNKIYIYYDVHLPSMMTSCFVPRIDNSFLGRDLQDILDFLKSSDKKGASVVSDFLKNPLRREARQKLTELCLYHRR